MSSPKDIEAALFRNVEKAVVDVLKHNNENFEAISKHCLSIETFISIVSEAIHASNPPKEPKSCYDEIVQEMKVPAILKGHEDFLVKSKDIAKGIVKLGQEWHTLLLAVTEWRNKGIKEYDYVTSLAETMREERRILTEEKEAFQKEKEMLVKENEKLKDELKESKEVIEIGLKIEKFAEDCKTWMDGPDNV